MAGGRGPQGPSGLPMLPLTTPSPSSGTASSPAAGVAVPLVGPVEYQVEGALPKLADHAPAYVLGTEGAAQRVDRLARALGLRGRALAGAQGWRIQEGTHALSVQNRPGLPWSFLEAGLCQGGAPWQTVTGTAGGGAVTGSDGGGSAGGAGGGGAAESGQLAVVGCAVADPAVAVAGAPAVAAGSSSPNCPPKPCPPRAACSTVCTEGSVPAPPPLPPRPADLPTQAEADRLARDLLTRAG